MQEGGRQPPRAPRATTSCPPSGCGRGLTELEKEPGEGAKRSSISSSTPQKQTPLGRRPPPTDCLTAALLCSAPLPQLRHKSQLRPPTRSAAEEVGADRRARESCSPAPLGFRGTGLMVCHPRRSGAAGAARTTPAPPRAAAPPPPPRPVTQLFPGSGRTARLGPCVPLHLIGPPGVESRPLPRDEVAGETSAPVPMTTGVLGLAFSAPLTSRTLRLMAESQSSKSLCCGLLFEAK